MKSSELDRWMRKALDQKYLTIPKSLVIKKMGRYEKLMNIALLMRATRKTEIHPAQRGMVKALEKKVGRLLDDIIEDFLELELMGVFEFSEDRQMIHFQSRLNAPPLAVSRLI